MSKSSKKSMPLFGSQATATVSVSLVLLILGIVALMSVAADRLTRSIKENVGFVAIVSEQATDRQVAEIRRYFDKAQWVKEARYSTPDEVMERWKEMSGDTTDMVVMLGVNPFSPEFEVKVTADYASSDSLARLVEPLRALPAIEEVTVQTDMVDSLNKTFDTLSIALLIVAVALLLISFGLINNTVRLTVYARRFTIHTMQLVGATDRYIRRPIVGVNMLSGAIAGALASAILAALVYYSGRVDPTVSTVVAIPDVAVVAAAMVIAGMCICGLAALLAANKYLRSDYDSMFG